MCRQGLCVWWLEPGADGKKENDLEACWIFEITNLAYRNAWDYLNSKQASTPYLLQIQHGNNEQGRPEDPPQMARPGPKEDDDLELLWEKNPLWQDELAKDTVDGQGRESTQFLPS